MNKTSKNVLTFAIFALCLLIIAYANHFNNGFHFDDIHTIVNNVFIRELKNIPSFFVDPKMFSADPTHWGLRSLVTTTLAIDYWLGGSLDPFWFQMSTFIWHIVLCIALFFLYRNIVKRTFPADWANYIAVAAASWYALHEVNAETLNYVISRSDVLSTLMIVLSLLIYILWPQKRKYYLYISPAFVGVFAKETVPVLIIIMFFYIPIFEYGLSVSDLFKIRNFKLILRTLLTMLPLIAVVVITQVYTLSRISSIPGISNPLLPYVLTQSYVWVHYFIAFFLPVNLSADSDWTIIQNHFDERIVIGCLFVIALVITIFKTSAKAETKPIAFGLIWFAAALLPTSLAPFAEVTNDHRMYFPFIGLVFSVVTYAAILIKRYQLLVKVKRFSFYLITFIICILGLNAYGIHHRNEVWRNDETLWRDVTIKSPLNGRGMMNYGVALMYYRNYSLAEFYFKKAEAFLPFYSDLYINLGILYGELNKPHDADENFAKAIQLGSDDLNSYYFYARYLLKVNRLPEAQIMAEKALAVNPSSEATLRILLKIYGQLQLWDKLQLTAQRLQQILPEDSEAKNSLAAAQKGTASPQSASSKNVKPLTPEDYLNASLKYYNAGLYKECIDACNMAIKLKPDYADAYSNIGAACNKLKQWKQSIDACNKALAINPAHKLAAGNLKFAEAQVKGS